MNDIVLYILLGLLVVSGLLTAMIKNTLKAVIALAMASALLTAIMFGLGAPLAAVFELSVCAGLVTAIFVSTISLTRPVVDQPEEKSRKRLSRYIYLPIIIVVVVGILFIMQPALNFSLAAPAISAENLNENIWHVRNLDIAGQIMVILAGVFGVVVLIKEKVKK